MNSHRMLSERYLPRFWGYVAGNHFRQTVDDYGFFATAEIAPAAQLSPLKKDIQRGLLPSSVSYKSRGGPVTRDLNDLLNASGTIAFLVIRGDTILDERFFRGADGTTPLRLMSATKSFMSALIGIALDHKWIESVDQPVSDFLPELKNRGFDQLTVRNLLNMESGIPFDEGRMPWSIQMRQYLTANARKDMLRLRVSEPVNSTFHYNDWHPNLLALIVETVSGKSLTECFETMLWKPIGAENPARLVLDSKLHQFPKMDSGLVACAYDLARFGQLYLNNGVIKGQRVLSESWIRASTAPPDHNPPPAYYSRYDGGPWGNWLKSEHAYYRNMWWGYRVSQDAHDYFAMGVLGQFLYVCPRNNLILIRLGEDWGVQAWWPSILKSIADQIGQ